MSVHQRNRPEEAAAVIRRSRVRAHPSLLGIDRARFVAALVGAPAYARGDDLPWSVLDERPPSRDDACAIWDEMCGVWLAGDP